MKNPGAWQGIEGIIFMASLLRVQHIIHVNIDMVVDDPYIPVSTS